MSPPSASPGVRRGERLFRWLHTLGSGCGKLPLVAGAALVLSARAVPLLAPPPPPPVADAAPHQGGSPDAALIDAVLTKRAPDLGLTLRRQLVHAIAEEAGRAGYDPLLILAIIDVESDFAEEAVSEKGARGLMQIKPSTLHFLAEKEGLRLSREEVASDPSLGVRLGIRYLRTLHDRFGDLDLAGEEGGRTGRLPPLPAPGPPRLPALPGGRGARGRLGARPA
jgi:soluble lytic murein transglycosylase